MTPGCHSPDRHTPGGRHPRGRPGPNRAQAGGVRGSMKLVPEVGMGRFKPKSAFDPAGARLAALAELRRVAAALAGLGGRGTIDQVAAAAGLPRPTVLARLRSSGQPGPRGATQYFACPERKDGRAGTAGVWKLTGPGERLAAGAA